MIKNFFSRTRRSKGWRARAEKMWTTKIFEDFFFYNCLNSFIEDSNCHSIFAYNMRKVMILNRDQDINAWNQQDKSNENKSFLWFHFETGFWSWKPGSSVYKCLYYLGCQEIHKLYYFLYFLDISDFCCNFWLNTEANHW